MIAAKPYTIFGCCDHFEHENALDDALASAYSLDNSDYHSFVCIECPDGTVIDERSSEYREYAKSRRTRDIEQRASTPTIYGRVEVRGPIGDYWRREYTYSEAEHQRLAQKYTEWYGPDRVRTGR